MSGWAMVTGGSSGMGLEYARQLAAKGYDLLLVSNQEEELQRVAVEIQGSYPIQVLTRYQDLSSEQAAEDLFSFCQKENLSIDILVNNAGMFFFEELSPDIEVKALAMMRLHMFTSTRLCVLFGNEMKKRGHG